MRLGLTPALGVLPVIGQWAGQNMIPAAILAARWRADQGTTIATGVSQWDDMSGNGHHQIQATGSKQPALALTGGPNGTACITADGSNDVMRAAFTLNQPIAIYLVAKYTNAFAHNEDLFDGGGGAGSHGRFYRTAAQTMNLEDATNINGTVNTTTAWHYYRIDCNGVFGAVYQDNVLKFSGNAGVGAMGGVNLFSYADQVSDCAAASIAEMIVLSAIPSAAQDAAVNSYLTSFYGL